jgi:hypothetical protein
VRAASQSAGIVLAWGRARPGSRLIVIPKDVDEALALVDELAAGTAGVQPAPSPSESQVAA